MPAAAHHGDCLEILPEFNAEEFEMALTNPSEVASYSGRWDGTRNAPVTGVQSEFTENHDHQRRARV